jgi:hypothetical protein
VVLASDLLVAVPVAVDCQRWSIYRIQMIFWRPVTGSAVVVFSCALLSCSIDRRLDGSHGRHH